MMRMMFDGFIGRTASLGSPGVNEVRWLAPLRPGDDLTLDVEVDGGAGFAQPSRDRHRDVQGRGPQRRRRRRCARWCRRSSCAGAPTPRRSRLLMRFFEDIEIGAAARDRLVHLHRRTDQEIRRAVRSAALSSRRGGGPQIAVRRAGGLGLACRFGLHEAAGRRRPASGAGGRRARREGRGLGAVAGLSRTALDQAGAGRRHHQLRQRGRIASASSDKRPEWGILQARNTGTNQRGELVFSFLATAFVPRRKPAEEPTRPSINVTDLLFRRRGDEFRGTNFLLTHFELMPVICDSGTVPRGRPWRTAAA